MWHATPDKGIRSSKLPHAQALHPGMIMPASFHLHRGAPAVQATAALQVMV
jgi:hypothetical protein